MAMHVLVGTAARIRYEFKNCPDIGDNTIKTLVLIESKNISLKSSKEQTDHILTLLNHHIQIVVLSNTLSPKVLAVTKQIIKDETHLLVKKTELIGCKQFFVVVDREELKLTILLEILETVTTLKVIIFCETRRNVDRLVRKLTEKKFTVSYIHGDIKRAQRDKMLVDFKKGFTRVIITTDLLAKSNEVKHASLVINYEWSVNADNRCRSGLNGAIFNILSPKEKKLLSDFEFYNTKIMSIPKDLKNLM